MSNAVPFPTFGTDGIRGRYPHPLSASFFLALGQAAARVMGTGSTLLLGHDPRESSEVLGAALASGLASGGVNVTLCGVLPTPAIAALVVERGLDYGAVISASHNPAADNGVKFFDGEGAKIDDALEREIEAILAGSSSPNNAPSHPGRVAYWQAAGRVYLERLYKTFPLNAGGWRIALDCANGAMSDAAPVLLRRLGATVEVFNANPDGRNINAGCGSTHLEALQAEVAQGQYSLGFAFDGDGDRLMAVDAQGNRVAGDVILAILARHLHEKGRLIGERVVTTVMTNLGFQRAMEKLGIGVLVTPVGDRYVRETLVRENLILGGEQSGHLLYLPGGPSGDGLATAALLLRTLVERGTTLAQEAEIFSYLPQRLVNFRLANARNSTPGLEELAQKLTHKMNGRGRILLRPSGTEPLLRLMVEAEDDALLESVCTKMGQAIQNELGAAPVR